ncbi:MAG: preprotein translocase subunit SecG [Candidatus Liptonbacteria bacterium]|nr:preprotein translocase subunit SecG [Candidatus Liptonbacteria bacterium]
MQVIISVIQLIIAVVIVVLILLQERSSGLSGVLGGSESSFYQTRRGLEKIIFRSTVLLVFLFVILSLVNLVI